MRVDGWGSFVLAAATVSAVGCASGLEPRAPGSPVPSPQASALPEAPRAPGPSASTWLPSTGPTASPSPALETAGVWVRGERFKGFPDETLRLEAGLARDIDDRVAGVPRDVVLQWRIDPRDATRAVLTPVAATSGASAVQVRLLEAGVVRVEAIAQERFVGRAVLACMPLAFRDAVVADDPRFPPFNSVGRALPNGVYVIRDRADWTRLWKGEHTADVDVPAAVERGSGFLGIEEPPAIDFATHSLVLLTASFTGSYGPAITAYQPAAPGLVAGVLGGFPNTYQPGPSAESNRTELYRVPRLPAEPRTSYEDLARAAWATPAPREPLGRVRTLPHIQATTGLAARLGMILALDPESGILVNASVDGPRSELGRLAGATAVAVDPFGRVYMAGGSPPRLWRAGEAAPLPGELPLAPRGLAVDRRGVRFVSVGHAVARVSPGGQVTILAGSLSEAGEVDGNGAAARFREPCGLAFAPDGSLYVADKGNSRLRKIEENGDVGAYSTGGTLLAPEDVAVSADGVVYVADTGNHRIVTILDRGMLSVVAGSGQQGDVDGPNGEARFDQPAAIDVQPDGRVVVADRGTRKVRVIE